MKTQAINIVMAVLDERLHEINAAAEAKINVRFKAREEALRKREEQLRAERREAEKSAKIIDYAKRKSVLRDARLKLLLAGADFDLEAFIADVLKSLA